MVDFKVDYSIWGVYKIHVTFTSIWFLWLRDIMVDFKVDYSIWGVYKIHDLVDIMGDSMMIAYAFIYSFNMVRLYGRYG
jgi:hypothetical protein